MAGPTLFHAFHFRIYHFFRFWGYLLSSLLEWVWVKNGERLRLNQTVERGIDYVPVLAIHLEPEHCKKEKLYANSIMII